MSRWIAGCVFGLALVLAVPAGAMNDADNDGLTESDPCPSDPRNLCFGVPALDPFTARALRINANTSSTAECAGDKIDCNGDLWSADIRYNELAKPSQCNLNGGEENCVISGITDLFGCDDESTEDLFQCGHSDPTAAPDLGWDFPIADGNYLVNVYFANTYDGTTQEGQRVFDIVVEDEVVYASFDQVEAAGASAHAVVRSVLADVDDGNGLQIALVSLTQRASIKAIEVLGSNAGTCLTTIACPAETSCDIDSGLCVASGNLQDELVVSGLDEPTSLAFLPDGRALILEKDGDVVLIDPSSAPATTKPYLDLPSVEQSGEAGLLDVTLDPDFETNGHLYLYYAHGQNSRHRISRFTHHDDHADLADEVLIWEDDQPYENCCHYGGGLDFGPDDKLYLTLGEKHDPQRAQDMTLAAGKIIRLNKDGTVPTDNPFYDGAGPNYDAMWALGLRNPFRARFDDPSGRLIMGDLGFNSIESVNIGAEGANYAWPFCEGACGDPTTYTDAVFEYRHIGGGQGIMGGVVYRGTQFPAAFEGAYFYGDFAANWIRYLTFDPSGTVVTGNFDFLDNIGDVVAIEQSPDGSLYYLRHDGSLRRVRYSPSNQAPVIVEATAAPLSGPAPLTVTFTAEGTDSDDDPLSYRWIFGDGEDASTANAEHTYSTPGIHTARLVLSDGGHDVLSDPVEIAAGAPPTATISSPIDGSSFAAGALLAYSGHASDPVESLDGSNMSWDVLLHHAGHIHPRQGPVSGTSGGYQTPATGHPYGDDTHFEIRLTVTDSDGLTDTASVSVFPSLVEVTFDSAPSGIDLVLDGIVSATPHTIDEAISFGYAISAPETACLDDASYAFDHWSDGGARTHGITIGDEDESYTAHYISTGSCLPSDCTTDDDCSDGLYCNGSERCTAEADCTAGVSPCNDGVACTIDGCNEDEDSCSNSPSHQACNDGNPCNGTESCDPQAGCLPGSAIDCAHLDSMCSLGECDQSDGTCTAAAINEDGACDDGNACTLSDTCSAGTCTRTSFCGVPASRGDVPVASDVLFTLRTAVGLSQCPMCECDVNSDGVITVHDALTILAKAVELDVELGCFVPIVSSEAEPGSQRAR